MSLISMFDVSSIQTAYTSGKPGIVVDNNDPKQICRIRVTIPQIYEIQNDDVTTLPWVYKFNQSFLGGSINSESFSVPEIGSLIWVFYPLNDKKFPFYTNYPYGESCKTKHFIEHYPHMYGFKDSSGLLVRVDKFTKDILVQYNNKFSANINGETGDVNIVVNGNTTITTQKITANCGQIAVTSTENVNLKANTVNVDASKTNLGSGGKQIARLGDQVTVEGKKGTITSAGTNTSI